MKKIIILLVMVIGFASCDSDPILYDVQNGQTLVQFVNSSGTLAVSENGGSIDIPVTVTTVSNSDRTIQISVDESSTADPSEYVIENAVVPAGSYLGTVTVTGNFDAIPDLTTTTLVLNLDNVEGGDVVEKGKFTLGIFRKCAIDKTQFVGTWSGPGVWAGVFGGYNTKVVTKLDENGDLLITGILFEWLEDPNFWAETILSSEFVKITIDEETGEINIPEQYYVTTLYDGSEYEYTIKATGTVVNACNKTIEIRPVLMVDGSVYTGSEFGTPVFVERIQLSE